MMDVKLVAMQSAHLPQQHYCEKETSVEYQFPVKSHAERFVESSYESLKDMGDTPLGRDKTFQSSSWASPIPEAWRALYPSKMRLGLNSILYSIQKRGTSFSKGDKEINHMMNKGKDCRGTISMTPITEDKTLPNRGEKRIVKHCISLRQPFKQNLSLNALTRYPQWWGLCIPRHDEISHPFSVWETNSQDGIK